MKNLEKIANLTFIKLFFLTVLLYGVNIIYTKKIFRKYPQDTLIGDINKDTIFVFDLHGVVFKLDSIKVIKEAFCLPNKLKFLWVAMHFKTMANVIYSLYQGTVVEKIVLNFDKQFPNLEFISNGLRILNSQAPINESVEIIKDLKKAGYKVYVLSNIGEHSLEILKNKFPEIFNNFDGIMGTVKNDDYIQKPDIKAFEKFITKFDQKKCNIIFIDDQIKNILSARNYGISSILFTTAYNLRKKLNSLKVL